MNWTDIENIPVGTLSEVSGQQAWHYSIIPYEILEDKMMLVGTGKSELDAEELEILFGKEIQIIKVDEKVIEKALNVHYRRNQETKTETVTASEESDFIQTLTKEALALDASDIHLEPYEFSCRIRFRVDGKLIERFELSKEDYPGWVNRIKIKSNLDIAEKRLPQDGRIFHKSNDGSNVDIRVSILPTLHGEKVVLRLLKSDASNIEISKLGFSDNDLSNYKEAFKKPQGIVLISGPTGSGKTTTLYATLKKLNESSRNVLTIEDPIEYTLEGVNQVQLKEAIGMDFPAAMRTFLRQDPDVIMVGEIRDKATAEMAIRASLTGHLVLSTLHTNSAWGIISRLADMGVQPYLLAETLNAAVAQRLVRKLCLSCKSETTLEQEKLPRNFRSENLPKNIYSATGCPSCHFTGYKGRAAVYEVIPIDEELSEAIKNKQFSIKELRATRDIKSLAENALALLKNGTTSIEEIYPILINS